MNRNKMHDAVDSEFSNINRVTMMPFDSASGEVGPTLFVFKCSKRKLGTDFRSVKIVGETCQIQFVTI